MFLLYLKLKPFLEDAYFEASFILTRKVKNKERFQFEIQEEHFVIEGQVIDCIDADSNLTVLFWFL